MFNYIIRRLLLLPLTLFCIILVNFIIINLAPGDPVTITEVSQEGASRKEGREFAFGTDDRYLQFREHYGLTLPILFNTRPWLTEKQVRGQLWSIIHRKASPESLETLDVKKYEALRIEFGDQARFVMGHLLKIIEDPLVDSETRRIATRFFIRGGTQQAYLGPGLNEEEKKYNRKISYDNSLLRSLAIEPEDTSIQVQQKIVSLKEWYEKNKSYYDYNPSPSNKLKIFLFDTRFFKYISRVLTLDFGTLRNDQNKTVISEVTKRFKYSLTLAIVPMLITLLLCQVFGFIMAIKQNRLPDYTLNVIFLILYATPVFVVAPFLIEKIALHGHFPFTQIPIPLSGFTSPDSVYNTMNSKQRLLDILQHLALPFIAVMYEGLASQSRLCRTAVLEVLRQDYVRTARAKGVGTFTLLYKHVGRNAAITIVTSVAGSLGIILGGSLIVETLFGINGFGKFFYDAVVNRDYNVIMFSALAGAFLSLLGYLVADIAYTLLDPRVTLD